MMRTQHERTISGFTLIEILVTIGLIILLLMLVAYPIFTGMAYFEKGLARADAQSAARLAIDAMTRELAEAMYVFDIPVGGTFVAFYPTRSSARGLPAGAQRAPIAPEAFAVRYSRALRDPALPYWPFYRFDPANPNAPVNPYYLARTEIEDPTARDDDWNDSPGAALTRAIFWYPDGHAYGGRNWPTAQPGYPWLEAVYQYGAGTREARDLYRQLAVALTPDDPNYDVSAASFSPSRITEEGLLARAGAVARDYSRYRARYRLWAGFSQWDPAGGSFKTMGWVNVYIGSPRVLTYRTWVDPVTGDVWVANKFRPIYNTASYPQRDVADPDQAEFAFGIDYDRGEVRFDFPAEHAAVLGASYSMYLQPVSSITAHDPQIVRGSTTVWVEDGVTGDITYYKEASPRPASTGDIGRGRYAVNGLSLDFDSDAGDGPGANDIVHCRYRYRNNPDDQLVVATYATKAIINIALTVSKRDIAARTPQASRQDVTLATKVKLKNVPR